jgi:hypothetical protein
MVIFSTGEAAGAGVAVEGASVAGWVIHPAMRIDAITRAIAKMVR